MADADVKMKFFGSPEDAERAIVQLERKYSQLQEQIKRTGRSSKDETLAGKEGLAAMGTQIATAIGGYLSLQSILQGVSKWYQTIRKDIDDAAGAEAKFSRSILTTLTMSGDLPVGPEVRTRLQGLSGITEAQALAAFGGVRGGAPTIGVDRALAITEAVSGLAPVLSPLDETGKATDTGRLQQLGQLAGTLSELAPQRGTGDVVDLALALQQVSGARAGELVGPQFEKVIRQMQAGGMTLEQALATASVGMQEGLSARQLGGTSKEAMRALAGLDQQEIARRAALFGGAQQNDLAAQQLQQALAVSPDVFARQAIVAADEKADRILGQQRLARDVEFRAAAEEAPLWAKPFVETAQTMAEWVASTREGVWGPNASPQQQAAYDRALQERGTRAMEEMRDALLNQNRQEQPRVNRPPPVEGQ